MHRGKYILATLLLSAGIIANAGAQTKLGSGIRKLFSKEKKEAQCAPLDYSRFPKTTFIGIKGITLENILVDLHPVIVPIEDKIEFSDFSDLPDEYNIWNNSSINPYNVSLVGMKDTVKIDLSGYCPPSEKYVTSNWGFRKWKFHYGIDLKVHRGDTVRCAFDGTVRITRRDRGYGYFVVVRHDNGLETLYAHLNKILVKNDQRVKAGEAVGMGGNTGRSTGPHLHFETRYKGFAFDPQWLIDFKSGDLRHRLFVLKKKYFSIYSNYEQDFEDEMKNHEDDKAEDAEREAMRWYTIKSGDTLGRIAINNGTTVNALCRLNGITPTTTLKIGRRIRVR